MNVGVVRLSHTTPTNEYDFHVRAEVPPLDDVCLRRHVRGEFGSQLLPTTAHLHYVMKSVSKYCEQKLSVANQYGDSICLVHSRKSIGTSSRSNGLRVAAHTALQDQVAPIAGRSVPSRSQHQGLAHSGCGFRVRSNHRATIRRMHYLTTHTLPPNPSQGRE